MKFSNFKIKWADKLPKKSSKEDGYSLLEILVVLAIIGTLMTLVAPKLMGQVDKSQKIAAKAQTRTLRLALDSFKLDTGRYPTQAEGLAALMAPPANMSGAWYGPYMDGELPMDPWNSNYIYVPPSVNENGISASPKVISYGADKSPGGSGLNEDISS